MRVLIVGNNYASVINSLHEGFVLENIACKSISFEIETSHFNVYTNIKKYYRPISKKGFSKKILQSIMFLNSFWGLIFKSIWASHVIYIGHPTLFSFAKKWEWIELFIINLFVKKKFVWFLGSDIRNPEIELKVNNQFAQAWSDNNYEYKGESATHSNYIQALYAKHNFIPIVWDMYLHINKQVFKKFIICPYPSINLNAQYGKEREQTNGKVLIVHAPSAPVAKGTIIVKNAIERLKVTHAHLFDFVLLQNISNEQYQQYLKKADIVIDQMIWGAYGVAAQQSLQQGCVVVCYLLEQKLQEIYGDDCPIINANAATLHDVLLDLIAAPSNLNIIKQQSIAYYERVHAPQMVVKRLCMQF